jgi:hypothetical protein
LPLWGEWGRVLTGHKMGPLILLLGNQEILKSCDIV